MSSKLANESTKRRRRCRSFSRKRQESDIIRAKEEENDNATAETNEEPMTEAEYAVEAKSLSKSRYWYWLLYGFLFLFIIFLICMGRKHRCKKRARKLGQSPSMQGRRFLVIRNYNNEAGFFFCIYTLLAASHEARRRGLELVSWFDSGLYLERDARYRRQYAEYVTPVVGNLENWFHYYFEPLAEKDLEVAEFIRSSIGSAKPIVDWDKYAKDPNVQVFEFEYFSFRSRDANNTSNYREWNETVKVRPHIQELVHKYWEPYPEDEGWYRIGIHVRGTDKMDGPPGYEEDGPKHLEYERYVQMVQTEIDRLPSDVPRNRVVVLACSDEQPFIDFIKKHKEDHHCPWSLLITESIRSSVNTSGWDLQSHLCHGTNFSENCRKYRALAGQSIHRGMADKSSYLKGENVLVEVLLLSMCKIFLRSRGSVSNFPGYINPQMRIIDMVEAATS